MNDLKKMIKQRWYDMMYRCYSSKHASYKWYGAKNIRVCRAWHDFDKFFTWTKDRYSPGLQIDRIDNKKGHSPGNCRFVTHEVNNCNRGKQCNNSTGYVGVAHRWRENNYEAKIRYRKKAIHLGRFVTAEDAVRARNEYIVTHGLPFPTQVV